jgi:ABC-type multidrug transport system permease subunit
MASHKYWPIGQLTLSRIKLFLREPAAIFWVYGFPIAMMIALGMAFRDNPQEKMTIDLVLPTVNVRTDPDQKLTTIEIIEKALNEDHFNVVHSSQDTWPQRLQAGKTDLVIEPNEFGYQLWDEPRRAESRVARYAVEAAIAQGQLAGGPSNFQVRVDVKHQEKPGSRYIDFLLPGMLGLGLMGGGMWGVGFVIVDMRVRKLLKRFLATPMRRSDFLFSIMFSRLIFTLADIAVLLVFGGLVFQVYSQGDYWNLALAIMLGAAAFAGIGLLVASRAETLETISGLMNLIMLPMWIFSGVFFSSERFPQEIQPLINLLPLTALNQLLRGIMLEGKTIMHFWPQAALLAIYTVVTFALALRFFRWR